MMVVCGCVGGCTSLTNLIMLALHIGMLQLYSTHVGRGKTVKKQGDFTSGAANSAWRKGDFTSLCSRQTGVDSKTLQTFCLDFLYGCLSSTHGYIHYFLLCSMVHYFLFHHFPDHETLPIIFQSFEFQSVFLVTILFQSQFLSSLLVFTVGTTQHSEMPTLPFPPGGSRFYARNTASRFGCKTPVFHTTPQIYLFNERKPPVQIAHEVSREFRLFTNKNMAIQQ